MNMVILCSELYDMGSIYFSKKQNQRKAKSYNGYLIITQKKFELAGIDRFLTDELKHRIGVFENNINLMNIHLSPFIRRGIIAECNRLERSIQVLMTCCNKILSDRKNDDVN